MSEEEDLARVGPAVPCVAPAGSTAEPPTDVVTAAERPDTSSRYVEGHVDQLVDVVRQLPASCVVCKECKRPLHFCHGDEVFDCCWCGRVIRKEEFAEAIWTLIKSYRGEASYFAFIGIGAHSYEINRDGRIEWHDEPLTEPDSAPAVARTDGIVAGHPRAPEDSSSELSPSVAARVQALIAQWREVVDSFKNRPPTVRVFDGSSSTSAGFYRGLAHAADALEAALAAALAPTSEASNQIEHDLRVEWWLNHGCDRAAIYGDDGEMQCNSGVCRFTDFKRTPIDELRVKVHELRMAKLSRELQAAGLDAALNVIGDPAAALAPQPEEK